jgi:hypothetical protein
MQKMDGPLQAALRQPIPRHLRARAEGGYHNARLQIVGDEGDRAEEADIGA